jgi:hypothetical protein
MPKYRDCRRVAIDVRYRAETRQVDERNGRDRGLEVVDGAGVGAHSGGTQKV